MVFLMCDVRSVLIYSPDYQNIFTNLTCFHKKATFLFVDSGSREARCCLSVVLCVVRNGPHFHTFLVLLCCQPPKSHQFVFVWSKCFVWLPDLRKSPEGIMELIAFRAPKLWFVKSLCPWSLEIQVFFSGWPWVLANVCAKFDPPKWCWDTMIPKNGADTDRWTDHPKTTLPLQRHKRSIQFVLTWLDMKKNRACSAGPHPFGSCLSVLVHSSDSRLAAVLSLKDACVRFLWFNTM